MQLACADNSGCADIFARLQFADEQVVGLEIGDDIIILDERLDDRMGFHITRTSSLLNKVSKQK